MAHRFYDYSHPFLIGEEIDLKIGGGDVAKVRRPVTAFRSIVGATAVECVSCGQRFSIATSKDHDDCNPLVEKTEVGNRAMGELVALLTGADVISKDVVQGLVDKVFAEVKPTPFIWVEENEND